MQEDQSSTETKAVHSFWKSADPSDIKGPGIYAKLPSYGQAYLDQLIGEFKVLQDVCENDKAKDLAQRLVLRAEAGETMTWGDAYMLDSAIAQMLPKEYLHQRAWCLEVKYRDAVGKADAYDAFMKTEAAHLNNETEDHLRARVHNLIRELYRLYTVVSCREEMRERLSKEGRWTLLFILGAVAVFSVVAFFVVQSVVNIWGVVFAAGATGGLLSLQRRLQDLPTSGESLSDLVQLSSGMTVKLTPIIGGTFALVLFMVFCSGLAIGPLFPTFIWRTAGSSFIEFAVAVRPANNAEWAKLLVWSFIAGFAERFVPDTLDRLIAKSQQVKTTAG